MIEFHINEKNDWENAISWVFFSAFNFKKAPECIFLQTFWLYLLCYFTTSCLRLPSKRMRRWAGYYIMLKRHRCFVYRLTETWEISYCKSEDNVRSDCYGYAITGIPGCAWGYVISSMHTFSGTTCYNRRRQSLTLQVYLQGFSQDLSTRRVELEACVFAL